MTIEPMFASIPIFCKNPRVKEVILSDSSALFSILSSGRNSPRPILSTMPVLNMRATRRYNRGPT
jgi:hypothetical protein